MGNQSHLSRKQLELQARIAKTRIEEIERILQSGVQAPRRNGIDKDTEEVIKRLYDTSLSDADISSCISILEMQLFLEGLAPLFSLIKSETFSLSLREQAAKAILLIGSGNLENELRALRPFSSPVLKRLIDIALGVEKLP